MMAPLWRRAAHKKRVWLSLGVILIFAVVAALTPWLAPHNPYRWNLPQSYLPPAWVQDVPTPGSPDFPLGTDYYGRDILSRLIYGTRTGFLLAVTAVSIAALIGTLLGLMAGYLGGKADTLINFLIELFQSVPGLMFMVMIRMIMSSVTVLVRMPVSIENHCANHVYQQSQYCDEQCLIILNVKGIDHSFHGSKNHDKTDNSKDNRTGVSPENFDFPCSK